MLEQYRAGLGAFIRILMVQAVLLTACGTGYTATQPGDETRPPDTLVDAWLAYPEPSRVAWPYAYIRSTGLDAAARQQQKDLLDEIDSLLWRLDSAGYGELSGVVQGWRERLAALNIFRLPGQWSVAWLMAHPNGVPPLERIAALGSCDVPPWIEVWDRSGVHRYDWETVSTLSALLDQDAVRAGNAGRVALVSPTGAVDHHGIRGWNFTEAHLSPGTRVIASLPLKGEAFPWIRDAMARLLARTPSGLNCRETQLRAEERLGG